MAATRGKGYTTLGAPDRYSKKRSLASSAREGLGLWVVWSASDEAIGQCIQVFPGQVCSLGRNPDSDCCISDGSVSFCHLTIERNDAGGRFIYQVTDCGSTNGTLRNGRELLGTTPLDRGDVLRLGTTLLVYDVGRKNSHEPKSSLVGLSEKLSLVRDSLSIFATYSHPIHVCGESGVGKELVAQDIHTMSGRTGDLVAVNMATVDANLAESQLFGHVKGAFTGADKSHSGLFHQANKGTLFLDEIADATPEVQAKLLRVLETGDINRLGSTTVERVDVRIVSATHHNLSERVAQGLFREDLYWRLVHTRIEVPSLRTRRLDIVPLVEHFLALEGAPTLVYLLDKDPGVAWSIAALIEPILLNNWPGNVRQLRAEVQRLAVALDLGDEIPEPISVFSRDIVQRERDAAPVIAPSNAAHNPDSTQIKSTTPSVLDSATCAAWLKNADDLLVAVKETSDGNVSLFARLLAPVLGKNPEAIRKKINRRLGLRGLEKLRE